MPPKSRTPTLMRVHNDSTLEPGGGAMTSGPSAVFCPAGAKTQVLWASSFVETYRASFNVRGVALAWERHSDLPPWFAWGSHLTNHPFDLIIAGNYGSLWFTSPVSIVVRFESIACGEVDFFQDRLAERVRTSRRR